ncbi:BRO family protein [Peptacetobacter sp. AB800]|uniref:BRO family protein n=1 Tax=Peptacetobacter sp. AB800 TaxID=3388428 RepID=UPI0039FCAB4D
MKEKVEVIKLEGKILFNARDVAKVLDIKNINDNLRKMNDKQVVLLKKSDIQNINFRKLNNRGENFLTKDGIYKIISSSNKMTYERKVELLNFFGIEEIVPLFERKECLFVEQLEEFLSEYNLKGIKQYPILNYRIDYYIPQIKLAIEYDENNHNSYSYETQEGRQKQIEKELGCKFVRLSDNCSDLKNIAKVSKYIH